MFALSAYSCGLHGLQVPVADDMDDELRRDAFVKKIRPGDPIKVCHCMQVEH